MRVILSFRKIETDFDPTRIDCPIGDELRDRLWHFHKELLSHSGHPGIEEEEVVEEVKPLTWKEKLLNLVKSKEPALDEEPEEPGRSGKYIIDMILI
mgnify:CR=1 FL=1